MIRINNYICGLDISSSKISAAVAQVNKGSIAALFCESLPSRGIKNGAVVNSIELTGCIEEVLKKLKGRSGINIKYVYAGIPGLDIVAKHSRAVIPLAERGNKVITLADIRQANEQARILGSGLEEEILHAVTGGYAIDSNGAIANPLGLYSHKLEADLYLVCGKLSFIQSLNRAVNQAGYEVRDLFFSGLASSEALFNDTLKDGATVVCDIGSDITEILLFREGVLKDITLLSSGGDELTCGLSEKLKIPFELAEDIKHAHGSVGQDSAIEPDKEILIKQHNAYRPVSQSLVCQALSPAAESLCGQIREAVGRVVSPLEINNFVAVGRTVLLEGLLEMLENTMGASVKLGRIAHPGFAAFAHKDNQLTGHKYLTYLTALGVLAWALKGKETEPFRPSRRSANPLIRTIDKFKEIYQEYF